MSHRTRKPEIAKWVYDPDEFASGMGLMVRLELALFAIHDRDLKILMVERDEQPFAFGLALPGAYIWDNFSLEMMATLLPSRLKVDVGPPHIFAEFSSLDRHPQHRAVSVGYLATADLGTMVDLTHRDKRFKLVTLERSTKGALTLSHPHEATLDIAFDHLKIIRRAVAYLRSMLDNSMIGFEFLPEYFTLWTLQQVHELILGKELEKNLFRKRMLGRIFADGTRLRPARKSVATGGRPARLYHLSRSET